MPGFRITPRAQDDLKNIGRYTERQWGKRQRNTYLKALEKRFGWVGRQNAFPLSMGPSRVVPRRSTGRACIIKKQDARAAPRDPHEVLTWVQGRVLYQLDIRCVLQVFGELQPVVRLDGILVARVRAEQLLIRPAPVLNES
jgi:plasmid stabilization system protein ParE